MAKICHISLNYGTVLRICHLYMLNAQGPRHTVTITEKSSEFVIALSSRKRNYGTRKISLKKNNDFQSKKEGKD